MKAQENRPPFRLAAEVSERAKLEAYIADACTKASTDIARGDVEPGAEDDSGME